MPCWNAWRAAQTVLVGFVRSLQATVVKLPFDYHGVCRDDFCSLNVQGFPSALRTSRKMIYIVLPLLFFFFLYFQVFSWIPICSHLFPICSHLFQAWPLASGHVEALQCRAKVATSPKMYVKGLIHYPCLPLTQSLSLNLLWVSPRDLPAITGSILYPPWARPLISCWQSKKWGELAPQNNWSQLQQARKDFNEGFDLFFS